MSKTYIVKLYKDYIYIKVEGGFLYWKPTTEVPSKEVVYSHCHGQVISLGGHLYLPDSLHFDILKCDEEPPVKDHVTEWARIPLGTQDVTFDTVSGRRIEWNHLPPPAFSIEG